MATLWEINSQIEEILLFDEMVDPETGEVNEDLMAKLDKLEIERDEKLESCGIVMKELSAEITAIKTEMDALKQRMTTKMNRLDRISEYVSKTLGGKKFETAKVAYSFRKSQKVEVVNEDIVPDEFCDFETKKKIRKTDIKKALKDGKEVPGCTLVENMNLQLR